MLEAAGIAASAIHGNKSQAQRERAIAGVPVRRSARPDRDRHRRARDRHPGRQPCHQLRPARSSGAICPPHRPHRARRCRGPGDRLLRPDERGKLRDIERLTRQKIDVAPLPEGFLQAAEALKRLKPAPKAERCAARPSPRDQGRPPCRRPAPRAAQRPSTVIRAVRTAMPVIARRPRTATARAATSNAPTARVLRIGRKPSAKPTPARGRHDRTASAAMSARTQVRARPSRARAAVAFAPGAASPSASFTAVAAVPAGRAALKDRRSSRLVTLEG